MICLALVPRAKLAEITASVDISIVRGGFENGFRGGLVWVVVEGKQTSG